MGPSSSKPKSSSSSSLSSADPLPIFLHFFLLLIRLARDIPAPDFCFMTLKDANRHSSISTSLSSGGSSAFGCSGRGIRNTSVRQLITSAALLRVGYMRWSGLDSECPLRDSTASSTITRHTSTPGTGFPAKSLTVTEDVIFLPGAMSSSGAAGTTCTSRLRVWRETSTRTDAEAAAGRKGKLSAAGEAVFPSFNGGRFVGSRLLVPLSLTRAVNPGIQSSVTATLSSAESVPSLISKEVSFPFIPSQSTQNTPCAGANGERTINTAVSP
mmetsp:Transcript_13891/g.26304  ORF Transcript_13891/g.26304 Transcript_13891/m.26304 type:complete len:270 (+) Transcript_13891:1784-2593(+)